MGEKKKLQKITRTAMEKGEKKRKSASEVAFPPPFLVSRGSRPARRHFSRLVETAIGLTPRQIKVGCSSPFGREAMRTQPVAGWLSDIPLNKLKIKCTRAENEVEKQALESVVR